MRFYAALVGDAPYASATLALVETRAARRPQPRATSPCSTTRCPARRSTWRNDPAAFAGLPGVLPRARARAPVVGPGGRLEELSRAVAQRRVRAVLRGAVRAARRAATRRSRHAAAVPALGAVGVRRGARAPRLPPRPHQGRRRESSARSSTTRAPRCCTCCGACSATRCSSTALRRFYDEQSSRRRAPTTCERAFEAESGRSLDRFFERWIYGADLPRAPLLARRSATRRRSTVRFEQVGDDRLRRAGHGDADLRRRQDAGRGRAVTEQHVEQRSRPTAPVRAGRRSTATQPRSASSIEKSDAESTRQALSLRLRLSWHVDRRDPRLGVRVERLEDQHEPRAPVFVEPRDAARQCGARSTIAAAIFGRRPRRGDDRGQPVRRRGFPCRRESRSSGTDTARGGTPAGAECIDGGRLTRDDGRHRIRRCGTSRDRRSIRAPRTATIARRGDGPLEEANRSRGASVRTSACRDSGR